MKRQEQQLKAGDQFLRTLRVLRERCPTLVPTQVQRSRTLDPGDLGYCEAVFDADGRLVRFRIRVRAGLCMELQIQVLMHEWAHALTWTAEHETVDDHDEAWGLALSRVYRELE